MLNVADIMLNARKLGFGIPAFNIPYLPMMQPVCKAVKDADAFSLIEVARLETIKFQAKSMAAVAEEFGKWADRNFVRLHLDHVPVIDEDHLRVDYMPIFRE